MKQARERLLEELNEDQRWVETWGKDPSRRQFHAERVKMTRLRELLKSEIAKKQAFTWMASSLLISFLLKLVCREKG